MSSMCVGNPVYDASKLWLFSTGDGNLNSSAMPVDFESCARIAKSTAPRAENWTSAMTTEKAL